MSLSLGAMVTILLVLEVATRRLAGMPLWYGRNFVEARIDLLRSVFPVQPDPWLGWIPKPGNYSRANYWGTTLRILQDGIRSNGTNAVASKEAPVILATGDSFTFGSQVGDEETWPAQLERLSGWRVINAGVFAYGLDQTVLRTEHLLPIVQPDLVIVSFIPDNVNRTERSIRTGVPKPYFEIVEGALVLRQSPVPSRDVRKRIGLLRRILGYSYLADVVMRRALGEERWYLGDWESVRAHRQGLDVGCLLMQRLARLSLQTGVPIVILAQQPEEIWEVRLPETERVIACATLEGLPVIDLYEPLRALQQNDPVRFRSFYRGHMTASGNAFVAQEVWRRLQEEGLCPSRWHPVRP